MPEGLEQRVRRAAQAYWKARQKYADYLTQHDPELWRLLVPCDPVITVAARRAVLRVLQRRRVELRLPDRRPRRLRRAERDVALGTTNVDYSWPCTSTSRRCAATARRGSLVDPAASRSRRGGGRLPRGEDRPAAELAARVHAAPGGDEPADAAGAGQPRGAVHVLAYLKRHRAATQPAGGAVRAGAGRPVAIVLEPWEQSDQLHDTPYDGPTAETIRTWGRDRLRRPGAAAAAGWRGPTCTCSGRACRASGRSGWARCGCLLGLSGWTANDWTGGGAPSTSSPRRPSRATTCSATSPRRFRERRR